MDELVEKIRSKQPDAIVVDRAVEGKNQNYLTPENMVPGKLLPYIIYLLAENEKIPAGIQVKGFVPEEGAKITMPGKKGSSFKWKTDGTVFKLSVSESLTKSLPSKYAVVFKVSKIIQ